MYKEFFVYQGKTVTVVLRTEKGQLRYSDILDDLDRLIGCLRSCRDQYPLRLVSQVVIDESDADSVEE